MKNIDDFIDAVKANSDWKSDYAIGKGLGYSHTAQVNAWKRRAAMPSIEDIISMADHAKLDLGECVRAVAYSKANERPLKQAGFADIQVLAALSGMSIWGVTYPLETAWALGSAAVLGGLYIMRSKQLACDPRSQVCHTQQMSKPFTASRSLMSK